MTEVVEVDVGPAGRTPWAAMVNLPPVTPTFDGSIDRLRGALAAVRPAPDQSVGSSREQFLSLAELARRIGGDAPGGSHLLPLAAYELKVFSQNGEDGVLVEILRRSGRGALDGWFVEFGAGDGVENLCAVLAEVLDWQGLYMEAGAEQYERLSYRYAGRPRVATERTLVTPENIERLLDAHGVPAEPDVLSIDVDGGDYWIWEALSSRRPGVVIVEYNGSLEPGRRLVQPRDAPGWDKTDFYGASIEALAALGTRKGYRLVHCDLTGNNAFFVRDDLPGTYPPTDEVTRRRTNFWLEGVRHRVDPLRRAYVDLDHTGAG